MTDCTKLVRSILDPTDLGHLPQIARRVAEETEGHETAEAILVNDNHVNVQVSECGLYLSVEQPYLGASPDGIVTCGCCEPALLEIKCPTNDLNVLSYLDETLQLKKCNSYAQIQGQMAVTGIHRTYFFIFHSANQHHIQVVLCDKKCSDSMLSNLHHSYTTYVVPRLLNEPLRKKSKKDIVALD